MGTQVRERRVEGHLLGIGAGVGEDPGNVVNDLGRHLNSFWRLSLLL